MTNPVTSVGQPELVTHLETAGGATLQHHSCPGYLKDFQGMGSESVPDLVMMTPEPGRRCDWAPPNLWVDIQHTPARHMSRVLLQKGN